MQRGGKAPSAFRGTGPGRHRQQDRIGDPEHLPVHRQVAQRAARPAVRQAMKMTPTVFRCDRLATRAPVSAKTAAKAWSGDHACLSPVSTLRAGPATGAVIPPRVRV